MNFTDPYGPLEDPGDFDGETVLIVLAVLAIIGIIFVHDIEPYLPDSVLSH